MLNTVSARFVAWRSLVLGALSRVGREPAAAPVPTPTPTPIPIPTPAPTQPHTLAAGAVWRLPDVPAAPALVSQALSQALSQAVSRAVSRAVSLGNLPAAAPRQLQVLRGRLWLTAEGLADDVFLQAGEVWPLRQRAVVLQAEGDASCSFRLLPAPSPGPAAAQE